MANCDAPECGRHIQYLRNDKTGKPAPVDPTPVPNGNCTVDWHAQTYHVMTKAEIAVAEGGLAFEPPPDRYTLHFATCPKAKQFRRCAKCHKSPCSCPKKDAR